MALKGRLFDLSYKKIPHYEQETIHSLIFLITFMIKEPHAHKAQPSAVLKEENSNKKFLLEKNLITDENISGRLTYSLT